MMLSVTIIFVTMATIWHGVNCVVHLRLQDMVDHTEINSSNRGYVIT
jgi:hypothetical protein